VLSTTTKIRSSEQRSAEATVIAEEYDRVIGGLSRAMSGARLVLTGGRRLDSKIGGHSPELLDRLHREHPEWTLLVESDGARGKSLKVPESHEPPLPAGTAVYVVVVGADSFGCRLDSDVVYKGAGVAALAGTTAEAKVGTAVVTRALLDPASYGGRRPAGARFCVMVNKINTQALDRPVSDGEVSVLGLGMDLLKPGKVDRVVLGSLKARGCPLMVMRNSR
jgi:probable selenium-dependent hydroxylase accessory protein YqeC